MAERNAHQSSVGEHPMRQLLRREPRVAPSLRSGRARVYRRCEMMFDGTIFKKPLSLSTDENCVRVGATAPYMEILGGVHLA